MQYKTILLKKNHTIEWLTSPEEKRRGLKISCVGCDDKHHCGPLNCSQCHLLSVVENTWLNSKYFTIENIKKDAVVVNNLIIHKQRS